MEKKTQRTDTQILAMYAFIGLFVVFAIVNLFYIGSNPVPSLLMICVSTPIAVILALEGIEIRRRVINRQQEIDTLRMIVDSRNSKA